MPSTSKKVRNLASHTKMAFDRQEFKYLVPLSMVDHIIAQLDQIMVRDKFSKDDYYGVYSIYFDTHDWQAFYSKMDGNLHRKKLRLRSYSKNPEPNEKIFAEIKEKNDREILKRRVAI
ncbi:VTC domain-containing protein, partial [Candidatus Saccharibacteria bacterium]|nr:VTC domain-containing protein [Candidatus Saccharibacteria bacterium]